MVLAVISKEVINGTLAATKELNDLINMAELFFLIIGEIIGILRNNASAAFFPPLVLKIRYIPPKNIIGPTIIKYQFLARKAPTAKTILVYIGISTLKELKNTFKFGKTKVTITIPTAIITRTIIIG